MVRLIVTTVAVLMLANCNVGKEIAEKRHEADPSDSTAPSDLNLFGTPVTIPTGGPNTYIEQCREEGVETPPLMPASPKDCVPGRTDNGWTCAGGLPANCNLAGSGPSPEANLWVWTGRDTICFYLPRWDGNDFNAQGTLCFNKNTCTACAFDSSGDWKKTPGDLNTPGRGITDNCAACHRDGVVSPSVVMQDLIDGYLNDWIDPLRRQCGEQCGVKWVLDRRTLEPWAQPNPKNCCEPPSGCESCHSKFVKAVPDRRGDYGYCGILEAAIGHGDIDDGSMEGLWPIDSSECNKFFSCMACDELGKKACSTNSSTPSGSPTPPPNK